MDKNIKFQHFALTQTERAKIKQQTPIFAVSRSHLNQQTKDFIQRHQGETIAAGSSIKLTMLAEGLTDAYLRFGPTSLWDMAAGHAILKEMGGEIFGFTGNILSYHVSKILNPDLIALRDSNAVDKFLSE